MKNRIAGSQSNEAYIRQWQEEEYQTNCSHPENLQHKSLKGERLRSKSEVIIANALYMNHIPYRYECELELGEVTLYPDFTILHPETLEVYYWEHFGMMDYPEYSAKAIKKIAKYEENGYWFGDNFLCTFETREEPLNMRIVEKMLKHYF